MAAGPAELTTVLCDMTISSPFHQTRGNSGAMARAGPWAVDPATGSTNSGCVAAHDDGEKSFASPAELLDSKEAERTRSAPPDYSNAVQETS